MNIKNLKQFDENSEYYAGIVNRIAERKAKYDKKLAAMKSKLEAENNQDMLDKKKLEDALLSFADQNYDDILPEGKKTYTNAFIKLTVKLGKPSISFLTDISESDVITKLKAMFKKKASSYITVTEALSKSVVLKAAQSDEISEEQLTELGMETTQVTNITIKPL